MDADLTQIRYVKYIMLTYELASGLQTNFSKTNLFAVGEVPNMDALTDLMGCVSATFPTTYLGLPLGAKSRAGSKLDKVI